MPYLEIISPALSAQQKDVAARTLTQAVVESLSVTPESVTLYFMPVAHDDYVHAGISGLPEDRPRVFIKLHAYRRDIATRSECAMAVTRAFAQAYLPGEAEIAVYFMQRELEEVSHYGVLSSSEQQ